MRVYVYLNLRKTREGCRVWSIMDPKKRKVVDHTSEVWVKNPEFRVRPGGRDRVRASGQKNVHAFVIGEVIEPQWKPFPTPPMNEGVTYNPFKNDSFVLRSTGAPIFNADLAILNREGCWALRENQ